MEVVYFELNNWMRGSDYPDKEPFITWMADDFNIAFLNEKWVKENNLCVLAAQVDMSANFCITAPKEWVEAKCPSLFEKYKNFIRFPDKYGDIFGKFGHEFLEYKEENIGITFHVDEDD